MKAFLWTNLQEISNNYHRGGAVLVISYSLQNARRLEYVKNNEELYLIPPCDIKEIQEKEPDEVFYAPEHIDSKAYYFLDAGCC